MNCDPVNEKGFIGQFLAHVAQNPQIMAVEMEGENNQLTYQELLITIEEWIGRFQQIGITKGERVLLLLPTGIDFLATFYALTSLEAISVLTNCKQTPFEMDKILRDARPGVVITTSAIYSNLHQTFRKKYLKSVIVIDALPIPENEETVDYSVFRLTDLGSNRIQLTEPDDTSIISCHYTYKGFGDPYGVYHQYHSYTACVNGWGQYYSQEVGARHLLVLPLYAIYGLACGIIFALSNGCHLILVENINNKSILALLEAYQASFCCLVPLLYNKLLGEARARKGEKLNLHPQLIFITGGSSIDPTMLQEVKKWIGIEPYQAYGLTETMPITASKAGKNHRGGMGLPFIPDTKVWVIDYLGRKTEPYQTGEIVVSGHVIAKKYSDRKEVQELYRDGIFHTGDLGYQDEAGYIYFIGRKEAFSKVASQMVDLREIEETLELHPNVLKARVIVKMRRGFGEYLTAYIISDQASSTKSASYRNFLKEYLSRHKIPGKFIIYSDSKNEFSSTMKK